MRFREISKKAAFAVLGSAPALALRLAAIRRAAPLLILNLHRVSEDDGSAYRPLQPRLFENLLVYLKRHFELVTFEESECRSTKPRLILSFDDGYRDFIDITMPLLAKHKVRVNHNVIPGCIESGLPPLNVLAQDFVGKAPAELIDRLEIPGFRMERGPGLGLRLSLFITNRPHAEQQQLAASLIPQFRAWDGFRPTPMMSLDDVRQANTEHELGAHSFAHASMEYESDSFLREDVRKCRDYFATRLDRRMTIYAFPNGSHRDGQIDIVLDEGVDHVLLVDEAFSAGPPVHRRFTFDASGRSEARYKALGRLASIAA